MNSSDPTAQVLRAVCILNIQPEGLRKQKQLYVKLRSQGCATGAVTNLTAAHMKSHMQ